MSGLLEEEFVIYEQFLDEQYTRHIQHQATSLLARNSRFIKDVNLLREKYRIDSTCKGNVSLDQKAEAELAREIERIASKIRLPGNWFQAVREFVLGTASKEKELLPTSSKKITASFANDHVAVKIYGDITANDLVETVPMIRDMVKDKHNRSVKRKTVGKLKPELAKTLLIHYLIKEKKMHYQDVIDYCSAAKLQHGMKSADVGRYIRLADEHVEKIYK